VYKGLVKVASHVKRAEEENDCGDDQDLSRGKERDKYQHKDAEVKLLGILREDGVFIKDVDNDSHDRHSAYGEGIASRLHPILPQYEKNTYDKGLTHPIGNNPRWSSPSVSRRTG